ncbi:ABC transporter permease subunit [Cnuibacter physcomitrellae]|uniref:ABC transporter permease subunit n=1 Tax=Cnuibacter physcomitrellae TaxID=1619308 RepID=UPI003B835E7E
MPLFLVASGLTLIYGVIGVLNFAHGSFFVVGALLATSILGTTLPTIPTFIVAVLAGAAAVALLGLVTESTVVRRLYRRDHITMLLATFAILLIVEGAAEAIWGNSPARSASRRYSRAVSPSSVPRSRSTTSCSWSWVHSSPRACTCSSTGAASAAPCERSLRTPSWARPWA